MNESLDQSIIRKGDVIIRKKNNKEPVIDKEAQAGEEAPAEDIVGVDKMVGRIFDPERAKAQKGLEVAEKNDKTVVEVGNEFYDEGIYKNTARKNQLTFSQGSVDSRPGRRKKS